MTHAMLHAEIVSLVSSVQIVMAAEFVSNHVRLLALKLWTCGTDDTPSPLAWAHDPPPVWMAGTMAATLS